VHEDGDCLCAERNRKVAGLDDAARTELNVSDHNTAAVVQSVTKKCSPRRIRWRRRHPGDRGPFTGEIVHDVQTTKLNQPEKQVFSTYQHLRFG
jgi:hypothetical protein